MCIIMGSVLAWLAKLFRSQCRNFPNPFLLLKYTLCCYFILNKQFFGFISFLPILLLCYHMYWIASMYVNYYFCNYFTSEMLNYLFLCWIASLRSVFLFYLLVNFSAAYICMYVHMNLDSLCISSRIFFLYYFEFIPSSFN